MYFFSLSSFVNNLKKKRYLYDNIVCDLNVLLENFYQNFYFELNVKLFCNFVELCTRSWTACRSQLVLYFTMHVYFSMHVKSRVWYRLVHGSRKQGGAGGAAPLFAGCRGPSPPKNCWPIIFIKGLFTSHPIFFATILARK